MRNHKICKKAILKFNISWRHNINDFLMYNVLFVQKSSVYNASLTNFRAKKIRELATKNFFYFLFFFLSICPTYGENLKRIWDYSNSICCFDKELLWKFIAWWRQLHGQTSKVSQLNAKRFSGLMPKVPQLDAKSSRLEAESAQFDAESTASRYWVRKWSPLKTSIGVDKQVRRSSNMSSQCIGYCIGHRGNEPNVGPGVFSIFAKLESFFGKQ